MDAEIQKALEIAIKDIKNGQYKDVEDVLNKMRVIVDYYVLKYGEAEGLSEFVSVLKFYADVSSMLLEKLEKTEGVQK